MTFTVPVATALLSTHCSNPRDLGLPGTIVPSREADLSHQAKDVRKFLDAIVSFLPTKTHSGQAYAMSLAITDNQARIYVSANKKEHLRLGQSDSAEAIVRRIWLDVGKMSSQLKDGHQKEAGAIANELTRFLLAAHFHKMRSRFKKWSALCERLLVRVQEASQFISQSQKDFIDTAKLIYDRSLEVFASSEPVGESLVKYYLACRGYGKALAKARKECVSMNWLEGYELAVEEEIISNNDNTSTTTRKARLHFKLELYVDKLLRPCDHIHNLLTASSRSPYNAAICLPLHVQIVVSDIDAVSVDIPSEPDIMSWLDRLYASIPETDRDDTVRTEVVHSTCNTIIQQLSKGGKTKLNLQEPHCECVLIRYHHSSRYDPDQLRPYLYIAVSKLSCLLCALYFLAYRQYASNHSDLVKFETAGCCAEVVACQLPFSRGGEHESDMDEQIAEYVMQSIERLVTYHLSEDAKSRYEHARKLSQSTTESASDDDTLEQLMLLDLNNNGT